MVIGTFAFPRKLFACRPVHAANAGLAFIVENRRMQPGILAFAAVPARL
jgi:hypothetical protein